MKNNPRKVHFVDDGKHFIRFSGKHEMVISVLEFEKEEGLLNCIVSHSTELKQKGLAYIGSSIRFENKFYLFVATEFITPFDHENRLEVFRMKRVMDRLAMWFKHTVLLPADLKE